MKRPYLLTVLALAALAICVALACGKSSSKSSPAPGDDDESPADDDSSPADDDQSPSDDDDDAADLNCLQIAAKAIGVCKLVLPETNGTPADALDGAEWCGYSEELFDKVKSPAWDCLGNCAVDTACSAACFTACLQPGDPGGTGCNHTAHLMYACGVEIPFPAHLKYYILEMDLQAACPTMTTLNWSCLANCTSTVTCSSPPTSAQTQAMVACVTKC
jgi:hypothetical protein